MEEISPEKKDKNALLLLHFVTTHKRTELYTRNCCNTDASLISHFSPKSIKHQPCNQHVGVNVFGRERVGASLTQTSIYI